MDTSILTAAPQHRPGRLAGVLGAALATALLLLQTPPAQAETLRFIKHENVERHAHDRHRLKHRREHRREHRHERRQARRHHRRHHHEHRRHHRRGRVIVFDFGGIRYSEYDRGYRQRQHGDRKHRRDRRRRHRDDHYARDGYGERLVPGRSKRQARSIHGHRYSSSVHRRSKSAGAHRDHLPLRAGR